MCYSLVEEDENQQHWKSSTDMGPHGPVRCSPISVTSHFLSVSSWFRGLLLFSVSAWDLQVVSLSSFRETAGTAQAQDLIRESTFTQLRHQDSQNM